MSAPDVEPLLPATPLQPRVPLAVDAERVYTAGWLEIGYPERFEWLRITLPIAALPAELDGTRVIHLSDLHLRPRWARGYDLLIERINQAQADALLFSGDFVEDKTDHRPTLPTLERLFRALKTRLGTFAVMGNHDNDVLGAALPSLGIRLIEQQRVVLSVAGSNEAGVALELIGLVGISRRDLEETFLDSLPLKRPQHVRIILSHFPDLYRRARRLQPDLFLAGHTHGGQVCLPGGWPLLTHDSLPRRLCKGVHRVDDAWFVVSRGFGAGDIMIRAFCPPQVMEILLRKA